MRLKKKFRRQWSGFQNKYKRFTWGGPWASVLTEDKRQNLTLFFYDGLFAAASDKIILTYITIYFLTLGATRQQIGLLNALTNLTAGFLLLPAALLVERTGKRKNITIASASASRVAVFLLALSPLLFGGTRVIIWVILTLALLREAFNHIGYPGWMALTGDIVPIEGRGRYFGTRNFIMGVAGMISALVVGEAITRIGEPVGYQLAFFFAAILGVVSISFFARLKDPQNKEESSEDKTIHEVSSGLKEILTSLKGHREFIMFCVFTSIWNFSINIAAPFFNVYMVDTLKFTAAMIGVITVTNTIANLLVQRPMGTLADKWGNRNVVILSVLLIPIMPLLWGLWVSQFWHVVLIYILAGILWGAFNLSVFNNLLLHTPQKQRARFSAFYQMVVTFSLSVGAALGTYLIPRIDFKGVTLASAGLRWVAGLVFVLLVRDPTDAETPEPD